MNGCPGLPDARTNGKLFFQNLGTRGPSREGKERHPRPQMVTALLLFCGETSQQFLAIAAAIINPGNNRSLITDHYSAPPARLALNVPLFEGPSPTRGEKSTSPVIKFAV